MWGIYLVAAIETLIIIAGAMLYHNIKRDYHEQYEEDSERIKELVRANGIKYAKLEAIEKECDKALKVNNYNNVHTTLRIVKELAVGQNN